MNDARKSYGEHFGELRICLIKGLVAVSIFTGVALYYNDHIVKIALRPVDWVSSQVGRKIELQELHPMEGFSVTVKLCFVAGLLAGSPVLLHQLWQFIREGLYPNEKKAFYVFAPVIVLGFISGVLVTYFFMVPYALVWLVDFSHFQQTWSAQEYVSMWIGLSLVMGLVYQVPLALFLTVRLRIIPLEWYCKNRRVVWFANIIVSGILTPPDVITQLIMAVSIALLYELGILLSRIFVPNPDETIIRRINQN